MQALAAKPASPEELKEIRRLLEEHEEKDRELTLLDAPLVQSIGWALVHFVWQGTVIGLATAVALRALDRARANDALSRRLRSDWR